jgi:hypothetical protein
MWGRQSSSAAASRPVGRGPSRPGTATFPLQVRRFFVFSPRASAWQPQPWALFCNGPLGRAIGRRADLRGLDSI